MMVSTVAVGTDGSQTAAEAVRMAADLASRFDAKLVLLSAFQDSGSAAPTGTGSSQEIEWAANSSARVREILARTQSELQPAGSTAPLAWTRATPPRCWSTSPPSAAPTSS